MANQENWYVVYTYPNSERKVYNGLNKRQITAFLPVRTEVRQWSDRKKKIEFPLFSNYVFVKVAPAKMWMVLPVDGVTRFVAFDGAPVVVKDSEISIVKKIVSDCNVVNNEQYSIRGEKVQVMHGPLKGLTGRVLNQKGMTKLYIQLETVHQVVSVEIDSALLGKVHEAHHVEPYPV